MPKSDFSDPLRPYVGRTIAYASFENETLTIGFGAKPDTGSVGTEPAPAAEAITVNKVSEEDIVLT